MKRPFSCLNATRKKKEGLTRFAPSGLPHFTYIDKSPKAMIRIAQVVAIPVLIDAAHAYLPAPTCPYVAGGLQMPVAMSQLLADPVGSLAANPEWTRYAFMFPVGILVATCAQTAGIGGAAIMGPFFLLGFPLLGPAYPLHSVAASVATAILSEAFGFSSGW